MDKAPGTSGIQPLPADIKDLDSPRSGFRGPIEHQVTVSWGDCDPAQIAYTANIPRWALEAVEQWYRECLGVDWYEINLGRGIGTPFVSLSLDFHAPITPQHALNHTIYVKRLGNCSISHYVEGRQCSIRCYSATSTAVFTRAASMKPLPIPPGIRKTVENYIEQQGKLPEDVFGQ